MQFQRCSSLEWSEEGLLVPIEFVSYKESKDQHMKVS